MDDGGTRTRVGFVGTLEDGIGDEAGAQSMIVSGKGIDVESGDIVQ